MRNLVIVVILVAAAGCAGPQRHRDDVVRRVEGRAGPLAATGDARRLGPTMSVDDVVAVALANNQSLRAQLHSVDASFGQWVAAGAVANPEVELEAQFPVSDADEPTRIEGVVLQELNSIFARGASRAAANFELEQNKVRSTEAILALSARAREAAWEYLATRELLELRRTTREAADASWEVSTRLRAAGNVSRLEVAQRRAAREQARLDLRAVELAAVSAREQLNRIMGLYGADAADWELDAELPDVPAEDPLPLDDLESIAIGASLGLEAQRLGLEALGARGRIVAHRAWPHIAVGVFAEAESDTGLAAVGPALEISLPLWGQGRGALIAAEASLLEEQARYAGEAVDLRADVRMARERLAEAGERARFLRDVLVPLREEITRHTLERYNAMHEGVFALLNAKRAELDARAQWIEAVGDYWVARTRVELILRGGGPRAADARTTRVDTAPGPQIPREEH